MAKLRIKNMMFYGFHGVYEYEREQGQKFYVDVEVETMDDKATETDDPKYSVEPASVYDDVRDVIENKRFSTIEALCGHVGDVLLKENAHFRRVTVVIKRTSLPIKGPLDYVECEVTRERKA